MGSVLSCEPTPVRPKRAGKRPRRSGFVHACAGCWPCLAKQVKSTDGRVEQHSELIVGPITLTLETWCNTLVGGVYWPSGMLLAKALAEGFVGLPNVRGQQILELGAGPGLPSLVCGLLGATAVHISDRGDLVPLIERNIELNHLSKNCHACDLDWLQASQSPLAFRNRKDAGPLDIVIAADVVYFEEQEPLLGALLEVVAPNKTVLVLAYRERTCADRDYLENTILPLLSAERFDLSSEDHGACEVYVGKFK